jgi:hypothetical protein
MANGPTRAEFEKLSRDLQKLAGQQSAITRELEIQFARIADLQADIDVIRSAWTKMKSKRRAKRAPRGS